MHRIRILLIEDNRILREGISALISGELDMKIVAASASDENTLLKAQTLRAQVMLMDLGVRNHNRLSVVNSLTKEFPVLKVIGMGLIPAQLDVVKLVEAGASGFILKDATPADFLGTIRSVAGGDNVVPTTLTSSLFSHLFEHAMRNGNGHVKIEVTMTKREGEIISLIADALSNKEIASRLNIATYTVKSHVHNILEKLTLKSRLQIAKYTRDGNTYPS